MKIYEYTISSYPPEQLSTMRPFCEKSGKQLPQSIIGHYFCKQILAHHYAVAPEDIRLRFTPRGKPTYKDDVKFSITHTGDRVFIAVCDREIGIDAEMIREIRPALFERVLTAQEKELLRKSNTADRDFLTLWTIKEAYFKATGTGIVTPDKIAAESIRERNDVTTEQRGEYIISTVILPI